MKPVAILYATREGHTRRIAEAIARAMAAQGLQSELIDLRRRDSRGDLGGYAAVVVASPVHAGKHAPEVIAFVKDHRSELARTRTAFVSVTLSQAGVQRSNATHDEHQKFAADVRRVNERFFARTGWLPARIENVAGALAYTRYNILIRFVMKRIARASGGSTDTTRDHDYTDWGALDRFVAAFSAEILADDKA